MVAEAEVMFKQSFPVVLDVKWFGAPANVPDIDAVSAVKSPVSPPQIYRLLFRLKSGKDEECSSGVSFYAPVIRSGSYADIGPRRYMEDEHICVDDLSSRVRSLYELPKPSAFYAVFDGHGGPEAAAYVSKNAIRLFFEDEKFPQTSEVHSIYVEEVKSSLRNAFLQADLALAEDRSIGSSSGTTALAALILGRHLMVANAGDCRAVLCRNGEAIDMSQDHRPIYLPERRRVEECGGFVDDGYLNGVLSVTRVLGDWDMKIPRGSQSPLIAEPEIKKIDLTVEDEFLMIGCDGICHLGCFDKSRSAAPLEKQRCCSLTAEAFHSLRSLLEG